jgi:tetratricopeptide (TPR) repeat protein
VRDLDCRIKVKQYLGADTQELIEELQELIKKYPHCSCFYNNVSLLYRDEKKYELALKNIYKAIELDPNEEVYYASLAEIYFCMGNKLEFYRNFDDALSKKFNIESILIDMEETKDIYRQALNDPEFIRILNKYNKAYFIEKIRKTGENDPPKL